jgi:peptidoglycan LD-endopeptidase CwlK
MDTSEPMLSIICPALADKIVQLANSSVEPVRIVAGFRVWEAQAALWAQGRTSDGPIVTDARPGASWHEFGLAVDLGIIRLLGEPGWAPSDPAWAQMGELGKSLGLFWGGDFVHNPDRPHFQLTGSFPESPTDEVRQMFLSLGLRAVWQAAGLVT